MTRARALRAFAVAVRFAPLLLLLLPAPGGCVKVGDSLGQSCLTDEDCFSGHCAAQVCVVAPPLLDAEAEGDSQPADAGSSLEAAPPADGAIDSPAGSTDAASSDAGSIPDADASPGSDAPGEASPDGPDDAPSTG